MHIWDQFYPAEGSITSLGIIIDNWPISEPLLKFSQRWTHPTFYICHIVINCTPFQCEASVPWFLWSVTTSWMAAVQSRLSTQNTENDLFNRTIIFYISLNKYIKLINSFGLGRHLLRQDIVTCTDVTL